MQAFVEEKRSSGPASLGTAFRFAGRELRGGFKGFFIFIACIALGVTAISGVASLSRSLTEGLSNEGQTILGGDIDVSLVHREAGPEEESYLRSLGTVSKVATMRAMARIPQTTDQTLVEVKAVDGVYPLYGEMQLSGNTSLAEQFEKANGIWGAVVDPTLLTQLGVNVGDELSVGRINVRISGLIEQEPDRLSGGIDFGPRLMLTETALKDSGLVQPGSLVRWHYRLKLGDQAAASQSDVRTAIQSLKDNYPSAGWRLRSRANAAPGLSRNIDRFAQFLTLVGLTALVVGGVGVANAVRAFLETKYSVIASFKSVGASGDFVFRVYLIQIMVLAGIGILIGLVLGALIPFVAGAFLATVLPVQGDMSIFPLELGLGVVYGFLTALAFALWPLGRAHDIPATALFRDSVNTNRSLPRKRYIALTGLTIVVLVGLAVFQSNDMRLALVYVGATVAAFALLMVVARLIMIAAKRMPQVKSTAVRLAIANIHRPGALTPSVVLSLGLGLTLLVALTLIDGNLRGQLNSTVAQQAPSFFFVDIQNHELPEFESFLKEQAPEATIQQAPMLRGRIVALNETPSDKVNPSQEAAWALRGDRGITYAAKTPDNSKLTKGTWWAEDHTGGNLVSFEQEIAEGLGLDIGDQVTVNVLGREITATIANLRQVEWQSLAINFVMVFSPNTFAGAPHAHLATVTWPQNSDETQELALHKAVSAAFPTVTTVRVKDAINAVNDLLSQLAWAIRGASSITLIASILVLGGALAAGHRNRIYDAVVLKTLGATRRKLLAAYIIEYAILGLATALFGVLAGAVASWFVVTQIMNMSFVFMPISAILAVGIALVLTVGFGLVGTWKVLGEKPAPVLRNL
ncbi:MAG: ABC transporter permease [Stappiaceae bacterium]